MKGIFVFEGEQIELETLGEAWKQNELVRGKVQLSLKHTQLKGFKVALAFADFKDVRSKNENSFDILEENALEGEGRVLQFSLKLLPDSPVTEKNGSLFILLKFETKIIGHLQLNIFERPILRNFIETFELFYRFKTHSLKNRKGGFVEYKMIPPSTREYANMDQVLVGLRLKQDELEIKYNFTLKALGLAGAGQTELKKNKKDFEQKMLKKEFEFCEGAHNPDLMKKFIGEALAQAAPKMLF